MQSVHACMLLVYIYIYEHDRAVTSSMRSHIASAVDAPWLIRLSTLISKNIHVLECIPVNFLVSFSLH